MSRDTTCLEFVDLRPQGLQHLNEGRHDHAAHVVVADGALDCVGQPTEELGRGLAAAVAVGSQSGTHALLRQPPGPS